MRELDCDFCGATAAGAYEVLPADLDPASDEQMRVVLCDSCRETLDGVLAPLLDRLGAGGTGAGGTSLATDAAGHGSPSPAEQDASTADADHTAADDTADATDGPADDHGGAAATEDDGSGATETDAGEEPVDFRKVMRFLNNREFPVDRAEVAQFAAGAYDLEDEDVREIFDYAIERGVLAEENGQLIKE
ncbi:hypothetical protein [Halobaculum rarum]|uniref:hypothetical protein n=1 Tax=Halobaculum rarum TaxID=3075122 RepID=UPI0032AF13E6